MREGAFNLGGEASGHIILSDFSTTGDGLIAAPAGAGRAGALRQADERPGPPVQPAPQKLENVRFAGGKPLEAETVKQAIARGGSRG